MSFSERIPADQRDLLVDLFAKFLLALILLFALFPIYWMVASSLKTRGDLMTAQPAFIPNPLDYMNYVKMWEQFPILKFYANSLILATVTTVLTLTIGSFAAYAFSRNDFPGKGKLGAAVLGTQMIPGVLILLPMYVTFVTIQSNFGIPLRNTYHGMIFLFTTFTLPFAIWTLRGYFDTIPVSLEDAARMDGCSRFQVIYKIIIPLAMPGIAATGMFVFLIGFNEVLFSSIFASENVTPFSIGIRVFEARTQTFWGQMMAASTLAALPLLIIFYLFQQPIIDGLTSGAEKG